MKVTTKRVPATVLVAVLLAALAAGCSLGGGGDKAGGSNAPAALRLAVAYAADEPDAAFARFFAARVADLSGGSLRVRVVFDAAGHQTADPEAQVARMVRDGEFDLGWIGSRAWDREGVKSFQALQAPFLVTSHPLLDRIVTSPLAARMLTGLDGHGFVGLALVPDRLRHPLGVRRPIVSPQDFAGARVRVIPSRATEAFMRALGAKPVHVSNDDINAAVSNREIDGSEISLGGSFAPGRFVTPNVTLFAKALTLFAGRRSYERLGDDQRTVIRKAARQMVAHAAAHPPSETEFVRRFCESRSAVLASREDLSALMRAAQPVYDELERDPQTRALIVAIRELKAATAVPAPVELPAGCAQQSPSARGGTVSASTLNGTYRFVLTKAGAVEAGTPNDEDIGQVMTQTLRDGRWLGGETEGGSTGTYEIAGDRIVFDWPEEASTYMFTFKRQANGDLDLEPVGTMDPGDRFNWASERWRRVGPPVRDIP